VFTNSQIDKTKIRVMENQKFKNKNNGGAKRTYAVWTVVDARLAIHYTKPKDLLLPSLFALALSSPFIEEGRVGGQHIYTCV
jgi:hypothetical protein